MIYDSAPIELQEIFKGECPNGVYNFGDPLPGQPIPRPGEMDLRIRTSWARVGTHKVVWPRPTAEGKR